ncbi:MAG: transcriptional regulator [Thermodesulfobacteriota bacterium]
MKGLAKEEMTVRQRIMAALQDGPVSLREIAKDLGMKEKELLGHLPHVLRSTRPSERVEVSPASCLSCGFVFRKRGRVSTPGKCPLCRSRRIEAPRFKVSHVRGGVRRCWGRLAS